MTPTARKAIRAMEDRKRNMVVEEKELLYCSTDLVSVRESKKRKDKIKPTTSQGSEDALE